MARRARGHGFTLYEVTIVIALTATLLAAVGPVLSSNSNLTADTRAYRGAEAAQRRNMDALARVLRGVDVQTLAGFNVHGVATQPSFSRVTGVDLDDFTYIDGESLRWMPSATSVNDVAQPGAVYLLRNGQRYLIADRVPANSFHLRQEGKNLVIHLSTYYVTSQRRVVSKTSESVVSVRN